MAEPGGWSSPAPKPRSIRIDPSWWDLPELQAALAGRDIAVIYRFLQRRGFSQSRIAALSGQNQSEVSAIVAHGRQVTAYDVFARLADGLRIPRGLMGLAYTAPVAVIRNGAEPTESRHVRRRTFMGIAGKITMGATLVGPDLALLATPASAGPAPDRIGLSDVQRIEDMTTALARQDLAFGGGACREAIVGYLNWAVKLRESTMTDEVRRALDTALSHLEELAGWTSYDLLLLDAAEHFYLRALHSAQLAKYPFMQAKSLARLGKIYRDEGQYPDALRTFQLATVPAREAGSPRMAAYLHVSDALTYAALGDVKAAQVSLRQSQDHYANVQPDEPRFTRFFNDAGLHGQSAKVMSDLAAHDSSFAPQAVEAEETALRSYDEQEIRDLIWHLTNLALNLYRSGDPANANTTTARIAHALPQVSSRRMLNHIRPLAAEAARHDADAADLARQLTTSAGRSAE